MPDELALPPDAALELAQQLIDSGRPFRAHEVLEASWKAAPAAERELWQGLAQVAVGLTHAQRGNAAGAAALLRRGAERVARYAPSPPHEIERGGRSPASALAGRIDAGRAGRLSAPRLTLTAATPARAELAAGRQYAALAFAQSHPGGLARSRWHPASASP